jgi:hypothetical protein
MRPAVAMGNVRLYIHVIPRLDRGIHLLEIPHCRKQGIDMSPQTDRETVLNKP